MRPATGLATAAAALALGVFALAAGAGRAQNTVNVDGSACMRQGGGTADVVQRAQAFAGALTPAQRQAASLEYSKANAGKWSNLPVNMTPRNGVRFGDMTAPQQQAAEALISAAMSSCGRTLFDSLRAADGVLSKINPASSWNAGNYYVAFVGQPSATGPWILQVSGHHLAYNIAYNGREVSATPLFDGVEPLRFTGLDGKAYEPLADQTRAMRNLSRMLEAYPQAKLEGTFRDVTRGPTNAGDVNFPLTYPTGTTGRGVRYADLTNDRKALVRAAMQAWVELPSQAISRPLMRDYTSDAALAETFIGVSGASSLDTPGGYVRIDGPRVWIEFIVQTAVADRSQIHFHTIWRDKTADYGGAFKG